MKKYIDTAYYILIVVTLLWFCGQCSTQKRISKPKTSINNEKITSLPFISIA